ncbi:enoyl-CoA hydratase/isomerase family protein [Chungangia koreensis]|uniref:Ethylmalonyl-CoA decarboxylase n=1 Tax=Chungangia koreensis TaxID=752657 RepID=A0ABV8X3V3_9LACT
MSYVLTNDQGILKFVINRPEKRNAINFEVMDGLERAVEIVMNSSIRYLVISGEGDKSFCSGGDLSEFHSLKTEEEAYSMLSRMADILYRIATLPIPVIALVNGSAVGGGCEIATACDYRIVSSEAKCGFIQGSLGITSGWGGGTYLIEKFSHTDRMLKFLSEATPLDSKELLQIGWASDVYSNDHWGAFTQFIQRMESVDPSVHRAYKEIAIRKWQQSELRERIEKEVRRCAILWESEVHEQAVQNFLSKKK